MRIKKAVIENFKCFEGRFTAEFNNGVNIIVGDNEAGKSTILEAVNLALSGILNGRYLKNELSQYLFNYNVVGQYLTEVNEGKKPSLPEIIIEVHFEDCDFPLFEGNSNVSKTKSTGVSYRIEFDDTYQGAYEALIDGPGEITTIPIEYYKVAWKSFARDSITGRNIPIKSVLIDSTSNKFQNGSDVYISRIIKNDLEDSEHVGISQAYRKMKETFSNDPSVKAINTKLSTKTSISKKKLSISVDLSTQNSWASTLMTYLEEIPFHQIGKGEQCIVKTNLALSHEKSKEASLVLLEEPENHLSHTKLNHLIKAITEKCSNKQVIITTHSSYIANKLGLENLILLNDQKTTRLDALPKNTFTFFKKLPGYQTLRMLLCRKAILVEGDSDELIFQKKYMETHEGRLPIEDGIDVISVKLTFKRFLDIAIQINQPIAVITDNDNDYDNNITEKYKHHVGYSCVNIFADDRNELHTLEPQFVDANSANLKALRKVLGIKETKYGTKAEISDYIKGQKTTWALKVFESSESLEYPDYINRAIEWCDE
ncbi:MAG: AAA family ATPase [Desulfobulbus sp.]|nr:AAA family ATPase [Desulfobulbus sp.]